MDINLFDINLNNLKYFYMVVKMGSFTKASEYFYISQPNISYAIKQLENYYGVKLLIRDRKGVKLTSIGGRIYAKIEELFKKLNECNQIIQEKNNTEKISIGIQSHIYLLLKDEINNFLKNNRNLLCDFYQDSTRELIEKLNENKIDLIIDTAPINVTSKKLKVTTICLEKLCFVSQTNLNVENRQLNINELSGLKLILPAFRSNIRKTLETTLNQFNVSLNPTYICNATDVTIDLVKAGVGVGLIFENAAKNYLKDKSIYKVNLDFELPQIPLCVVTNEDNNSGIVKKVLDVLKREE